MLFVIYEDQSSRPAGFIDKATVRKMIELENAMINWDKPSSENFRNKEFNGNTRVAWSEMCYAGLDAEDDPRTGASKCLEDVSYISIATMFRDNFKMCFTNPICLEAYGGPDGADKLAAIEAGSKEDEDKAFLEFFDEHIPQ